MAKLTIAFGVALILVGAWGFISTGNLHPTALIPTYFGLAIAWCGILANTDKPKQKMISMHIAVTLGLLGFIGAAVMAGIEDAKAHGGPLAHPVAVELQTLMAGLCLVFVLLCVRSFIAARKAREQSA